VTVMVIFALISVTAMFLSSGMTAIASGFMALFWMLAAVIHQLRYNNRDLMRALEARPNRLGADVDT